MRYLEDYKIGEEFITSSVTVTETHIVNWSGLTQDNTGLHMSEEEAQQSVWKGRIAQGLLVMALAEGLWGRTPACAEMAAIANFGVKDWLFTAPVRIGDTVHALVVVLGVKPSTTKPDRGILHVKKSVINQRGQEVQRGENLYLLSRRPAG